MQLDMIMAQKNACGRAFCHHIIERMDGVAVQPEKETSRMNACGRAFCHRITERVDVVVVQPRKTTSQMNVHDQVCLLCTNEKMLDDFVHKYALCARVNSQKKTVTSESL